MQTHTLKRNELGGIFLNFALAFNLVIANTYLKKRGDVITHKSENNKSWIDFFLLRKAD